MQAPPNPEELGTETRNQANNTHALLRCNTAVGDVLFCDKLCTINFLTWFVMRGIVLFFVRVMGSMISGICWCLYRNYSASRELPSRTPCFFITIYLRLPSWTHLVLQNGQRNANNGRHQKDRHRGGSEYIDYMICNIVIS